MRTNYFSVLALLLLAVTGFCEESHRPIQIGMREPMSVESSSSTPRFPLDRRVSLRILKGSFHAYLDEISRQGGVEFNILPGFEQCVVTAYLHDVTVREALGALLSMGGITYQQLGRSNFYTMVPRTAHGPVCPRLEPPHEPHGECVPLSGKELSVRCQDSAVSDFAELAFSQSDVSLLLARGSEDFPLDIHLKSATVDEAINKLKASPFLEVRKFPRQSSENLLPLFAASVHHLTEEIRVES